MPVEINPLVMAQSTTMIQEQIDMQDKIFQRKKEELTEKIDALKTEYQFLKEGYHCLRKELENELDRSKNGTTVTFHLPKPVCAVDGSSQEPKNDKQTNKTIKEPVIDLTTQQKKGNPENPFPFIKKLTTRSREERSVCVICKRSFPDETSIRLHTKVVHKIRHFPFTPRQRYRALP